MSDPRQIAAEMLQKVLTDKAFFSDVKNASDSLAGKDAAFANMLVLTALRRLVFLKKVLKQYAKKKLPEKAAFAEYVLLLGLTEILFMDTPDYAIINSWVDIAKRKTDKYVAGFVNAVLRKACADREELKKHDFGEFFTSEFYRILDHAYGKKTVSKIQAASLKEPALDITVKSSPEIWAEKLGGTLLPSGSIRLSTGGRVTEIEGYENGDWWVQDAAAALPVKCLGKMAGLKVLDMCAAPGGKTAQLINAGANVTSLDISESRLKKLRDNMLRLRFALPQTICADGIEYLQNYKGEPFDIILLDAPCSATGTLRRHPEIVHIKNVSDVEKQVALQQKLLNVVSHALKPSGILLYCVCAITKAEGEKQIQSFLETHSNFKLCPLNAEDICLEGRAQELRDIFTEEGFIRTLPFHLAEVGGLDSFFIAKLRKVA